MKKAMYKDIIGLGNCYGCGVCSAVCPVRIIRFAPDGEGFYRPSVAEGDKCINCGLCSGSCAALAQDVATENKPRAVWAAYSADRPTVRSCASGGVGYELARQALESGGAFCGARYNAAERKAEHYVARTTAEAEASKGSKYMQSDSPEGFREILAQKGGGHMIAGTPCQMASIRRYLRQRGEEDRYLLADFFCFGVPSLNLWQKYLADHEDTLGQADSVTFRDKANGWHDSYRIRGERGGRAVYYSKHDDPFFRFFLRRYVQLAPCYTCPFRGGNSAADIRLGDMWGAKYAANEDGVSVAVAMTEQGEAALAGLNNVVLHPETVETGIGGRPQEAAPMSPVRGRLLRELTGPRTLEETETKYRLRMRVWRLGYKIRKKLWRKR